jgi:hypothetical protein
MLDDLTAPPKKDAPIVVHCDSGDITERFRYVHTSADMVNTRAAKFAAGANGSLAGSVWTEQFGVQTKKADPKPSPLR